MAVPLKLFQRLLGHMAAAAATVPLGLLHMRPLQHWLHGRIPRWAWKRGTHRVQITPACRKTFSPWSDPSFLRAGVPLEQVSRHAVVFTDASATGWGATYNGHAVLGVWTGPQLRWHINCLELLAVRLALSHLRRRLQCKDVLVRTDNAATVAYINLARRFTLVMLRIGIGSDPVIFCGSGIGQTKPIQIQSCAFKLIIFCVVVKPHGSNKNIIKHHKVFAHYISSVLELFHSLI